MDSVLAGSACFKCLNEDAELFHLLVKRDRLERWDMHETYPSIWISNQKRIEQEIAQIITGSKACAQVEVGQLIWSQKCLAQSLGSFGFNDGSAVGSASMSLFRTNLIVGVEFELKGFCPGV